MLGAAFLTFNACKSELDLDKELKFSKLSVEEQKQKIEESGIEFVEAMEGLQETQAMTTLMNMLTMTGGEVFSAPMQKLSADIKNARKDAFTFFFCHRYISPIKTKHRPRTKIRAGAVSVVCFV